MNKLEWDKALMTGKIEIHAKYKATEHKTIFSKDKKKP